MTTRSRARRWMAPALASILLAGCGTTVRIPDAAMGGHSGGLGAGPAASGPGTANALSPSSATGSASPAGGGGYGSTAAGAAASGGASPAGGGTSQSQGQSAASATAATGTAAAKQLAANGPGVSATTITIGVTYYQNAQAANDALGAANVPTGDPVAGTRALISYINSHGGVAGRSLKPIFFSFDPDSSTPYASDAQAECSYFTQDNKVFAVIDGTPAADPAAAWPRTASPTYGASSWPRRWTRARWTCSPPRCTRSSPPWSRPWPARVGSAPGTG